MEENTNNTQIEENSTQQTEQRGERTFTQDDVNRIVQERLAKERNKTGQSFEERERDLIRRENRIICVERLAEKKYPKELVDMLDTSDVNKFMENAEKLSCLGIRPADAPPVPRVVSVTNGLLGSSDTDFRKAFGLSGKEDD